MKIKYLLATALCWLAVLQPIRAQELWTMQRCIDHALQNNLQIKQNQLNIEISQNNLSQSYHDRHPSLNTGGAYSFSSGRSIDPFSNTFTTQSVHSTNFSLQANMPLYNGGQITNTIQRNSHSLEAAKYNAEVTQNDITLSVLSAYLQIIFNLEQIKNAQVNKQIIEAQVQRTQTLIDAGVLAQSNLYDLQAQLANTELELVNLENALSFNKLRLKQTLQLSAQTPFDIVIPELNDPDPNQRVPSSTEVYQAAIMAQPQIKAAEFNVKASESSLAIARASMRPSLSLQGTLLTGYSSLTQRAQEGTNQIVTLPIGFVGTDPSNLVYTVREVYAFERTPYFSQLNQNFRQSLGLNLSVPIYNRGQVRTGIENASTQVKIAQIQSETTKNQLQQTIEQSVNDAVAAGKTFHANKARITALEENFRVTKERYEAGAVNSVDFGIAANNLALARADLNRAKFDYVFKLKIIDFYMGKPINF